MKRILTMMVILICLAGCKSRSGNVADQQTTEETVAGGTVMEEQWKPEEPKLLDTISIAFGDYEAMQAFSKKCQNGEYADGQTVVIDGLINNCPPTVSVGQRNQAGDEYMGTTIAVNGWTEDNYPPDDTRIKVNGKLKRDEQYFFLYLVAEPDSVEIIKNDN